MGYAFNRRTFVYLPVFSGFAINKHRKTIMNRGFIRLAALQLCFFIIAGTAAFAEAPWHYKVVTVNSGGRTMQSALTIPDANRAAIAYHHARLKSPALWLKVEAEAGEAISLRMGVPMLDRYRQARPSVAVLSPHLPKLAEEVPFTVPESMGGLVLSTRLLDSEQYRDTYTGVLSWRFEEMRFVPPASGTYYIVAYSPIEESGAMPEMKLWLTVGKGSMFRFSDLLEVLPNNIKIQAFFESAVFPGQAFLSSLFMILLTLAGILVAAL